MKGKATASDVLVDTPDRLGRRDHLRPARRRHQRHRRGAAHAAGPHPLHRRASRGSGRLHGLRLREVDRQARLLPGDHRARRRPPAERPVRRQVRSGAGAGDHRPAVSRPVQTSTQQDIDHVRLFQDVAEHSTTIIGAAQVAQATALACRTALARRGVAHLAMPVDIAGAGARRGQAVAAQQGRRRRRAFAHAPERTGAGRRARARPTILNAGRQDRDPGRPGCVALRG